MAPPTFPKIVRILGVRDTRDRIEVENDRWVPVPGTGQMRPCDRCGRMHEVHVDVELSDGKRANIGAGCAKGETMEIQSRIKSAVSAAKTRAKLAAELDVARAQRKAAEQAWREVQALSPPKATLVEERQTAHGKSLIYGMGDETVWTLPGQPFDQERQRALADGWRAARYAERGFNKYYSYAGHVADLEDRLKKIDKKIAALTF